jgi:large subunit ribosomal protein L9
VKVLLIKDVYKLGRAGDVKRVADGYGRNYLLPNPSAGYPVCSSQTERISKPAPNELVNKEMSVLAKKLDGLILVFPARASETGKLYGSITSQMMAEAIKDRTEVEVARRQIDTQPVRLLGEYKVPISLTVDLIPIIDVIVYREGESAPAPAQKKPSAPAASESPSASETEEEAISAEA